MARMDARVRIVGKLLARATGALAADPDRILKAQQATTGHNRVLDKVVGGVARGVAVTESTATGQTGPLPVRVYRPENASGGPLPLVLNFHGGGWSIGSLDGSDWLCSNVARSVGAVVVSVDYRLAPTHPWPAAAEDCYQSLVDVAARAAEFGADATRVAVMGDSAGGNLAAVVALMARDRSGPRIALQALLYPALDLELASPSMAENAHAPILTARTTRDFVGHYLHGADPRDPYVSPLHAPDHAGLPAALIQVAEHDPIRDDGLRYASALQAAGVPVTATTYVGMPHGYLSFPTLCRSAPQALGELCAELHTAFDPTAHPGDGHPTRRGHVLDDRDLSTPTTAA